MAGGRIKGITIEIDGSTTGLNKALKETESSLSSTQRSLKDVNRLLKVDPTSTELLSQKQKLLAQAVGDTKTKLDSLKQASEQAAKTAGNYDAWKEKYDPLQKEVDETKTKLQELKQKQEDLEKSGNIDTEEYKKLQQEVNNTNSHLKDLKAQQKLVDEEFGKPISPEKFDALQMEITETEQNLKNLEKQAEQSSSILGSQMQAAGSKIQETGSKISDVGTKLLPVTAAVSGIGAASVKTAADFESSMSQVQATMGITKDSMSNVNGQTVNTMNTLSALAKKMGEETAFSASECAGALNYLALAGYDTQQMCDTLPTVLNLAAAGEIDLASASDMVTDAMSALSMKTSEADTMVDQMAKTASSTNTSVAQLGEGILTIGATAKSVKGGTAELNTALGILANNGIKGAEGGTHLRNIILSLQNPTDKAAAQIQALGVSVYDSEGNMRSMNDILGDLNTSMEGMTSEEKANIISTIFNKTDLSSVNALLANTGETWDSLQSSITNSAGAAQQMADTQLDNLNGQITILKSAVEGAAISIGEVLAPIIKDIVAKIQEWTDKFNSLDDKQKKIIVTIAAIAAAIGPMLIIIGTLISSVGTITGAIGSLIAFLTPAAAGTVAVGTAATGAAGGIGLLSSGLLPVIGIIAGVVAAGVLLYKNWDTIKAKATELKTAAVNKFNELKTGVVEKINSLKTEANNKINELKTGAVEKVSSLKTGVVNKFNELKTGAVEKINSLKTDAVNKFNDIKDGIAKKIESAKDKVHDAIEKIKGFMKFEWSLPKLKMPHIDITGKFSLNPPQAPKFNISWHGIAMDKVMTMTGPSIFGYNAKTNSLLAGGEKGNEIITGEGHMIDLIDNAVQSAYMVMERQIDQLTKTVQKYFPQVIENMDRDVVMDGDTIVGKLAPKMDAKLGRISKHKERGN